MRPLPCPGIAQSSWDHLRVPSCRPRLFQQPVASMGGGGARSLKFCLEGTQLPGSLEAGLQHLLPSTHLSKPLRATTGPRGAGHEVDCALVSVPLPSPRKKEPLAQTHGPRSVSDTVTQATGHRPLLQLTAAPAQQRVKNKGGEGTVPPQQGLKTQKSNSWGLRRRSH